MISRSRHRDHLDIFIRLKGNRTEGGKKKARGHYTLFRKENLNLMKLFSFRTLRGFASHKVAEELVETTEFRDGAEEGKGETGVNWFINWSVTQFYRSSSCSVFVQWDFPLSFYCLYFITRVVVETVNFLSWNVGAQNWYGF